jgi:hypothetical protein
LRIKRHRDEVSESRLSTCLRYLKFNFEKVFFLIRFMSLYISRSHLIYIGKVAMPDIIDMSSL